MNDEISYEGDFRAYIALGRFVSVFANLDFQLTAQLSQITQLSEQSANLLLNGMSISVKLKKLGKAAKFAGPTYREYAPIYGKLSEYNELRNKLIHWSHIFDKDGVKFDISDPTKNIQKLMTAQRISIDPDQIIHIAEWVNNALICFYPIALGKKELLPEGYDVERLLREAPPVPKDRDTSLRTPV
ncbi:hypothetical protein AB1P65_06650 [Roseibium alexandrii]